MNAHIKFSPLVLFGYFNLFLFNVTFAASTSSKKNANTLANNTSLNIERISVTAGRHGQSKNDLALSLHSVFEDAIKNDKPQHISESLSTVSGVLINQLSGGQGHNAAIRMPINYSGYTLYLQDNIPLQSAGFFNHNALWWSSSNSAVKRIEVIKGAGTALYGSGAVSGTVNVITPNVDSEPEGEVALLGGDEGYIRAKVNYSTPINDQHGIRVSAAQIHNDGWRQHASFDKTEVNGLHQWKINENQSLKSTLVASDLNQQMNGSLTQAQFDEDSKQSGLIPSILASDPRRKTQYLRLASEWLYDSPANPFSVTPYFRYNTNHYVATWQQNMPKVDFQLNGLGLLALARFSFGNNDITKKKFAIGADLEHSHSNSYSWQDVKVTTTGFGGATYPKGHVFYNDTTKFKSFSPYSELTANVTENLSYRLGVRADLYRFEFENHLPAYDNDGVGNRSLTSRSNHFHHISPKASLNYQFTENANVFWRFANAIRIPTANDLYHLKTKDTSAQLEQLKEETIDTYEIGYNQNVGAITISSSIYYLDVRNAIVIAYDDFGSRYRTNAAKVKHQGIELAANWQINDEWQFYLAFSRSQHKYKRFIQNAGLTNFNTGLSQAKNLKGNSLALAPTYIGNLRLVYNSEVWQGFNSVIEWQSIGDYWMDASNTQRANGYDVVNLKFNYKLNENFSFHFRIHNVANDKYSLQNELRFGKEQIQPGTPRLWYLGAAYQF